MLDNLDALFDWVKPMTAGGASECSWNARGAVGFAHWGQWHNASSLICIACTMAHWRPDIIGCGTHPPPPPPYTPLLKALLSLALCPCPQRSQAMFYWGRQMRHSSSSCATPGSSCSAVHGSSRRRCPGCALLGHGRLFPGCVCVGGGGGAASCPQLWATHGDQSCSWAGRLCHPCALTCHDLWGPCAQPGCSCHCHDLRGLCAHPG